MPTRTCAICREKDDKSNLLRFVIAETGKLSFEFRLDVFFRLAGRGVYCHPSVQCLSDKHFKKRIRYGVRVSLPEDARLEVLDGLGFLRKFVEEEVSGKSLCTPLVEGSEALRKRVHNLLLSLESAIAKLNKGPRDSKDNAGKLDFLI